MTLSSSYLVLHTQYSLSSSAGASSSGSFSFSLSLSTAVSPSGPTEPLGMADVDRDLALALALTAGGTFLLADFDVLLPAPAEESAFFGLGFGAGFARALLEAVTVVALGLEPDCTNCVSRHLRSKNGNAYFLLRWSTAGFLFRVLLLALASSKLRGWRGHGAALWCWLDSTGL